MIYTNWSKATLDYAEALFALQKCKNTHSYSSWLELRQNGDQAFPIMIPNPELDDPFAWQFSYGTIASSKELSEKRYLNKTELDLTYNWISAFGEPEAIEKYKQDRSITKGLCKGIGTCFPIRIEDAQKYRDTFIQDGYKYQYPKDGKCMVAFWKPKDNIPCYIPDPNIGKVFTVCNSDDESKMSEAECILRTAETLREYAAYLQEQR